MSDGIQNVGAGSTDWSALLKGVEDALKTGGANLDPSVALDGENIVVTVRDAEGNTLRSMSLTLPEIDGVDDNLDIAAFLESVADKIDEFVEDLKELAKELEALLENPPPEGGEDPESPLNPANVRKMLFNLYAIINLMHEAGQQQRDTANLIRSNALMLQSKSIMSQAEHQRKAAWLGALVSGITFLAQLAMIGIGLKMQKKAEDAVGKTSAGQQLQALDDDLTLLKEAPTKSANNVLERGRQIDPEVRDEIDAKFKKATDDLRTSTGLDKAEQKLADAKKPADECQKLLDTLDTRIAELEGRGPKPAQPNAGSPEQELVQIPGSDEEGVELQEINEEEQIGGDHPVEEAPEKHPTELTDEELDAEILKLKGEIYEDPNAEELQFKEDEVPLDKVERLNGLLDEKGARTELASLKAEKVKLEGKKNDLEPKVAEAEEALNKAKADFKEKLPAELDKVMQEYELRFTDSRADARQAELAADVDGGTIRDNAFDKAKVEAQNAATQEGKVRAYAKAKLIDEKVKAGATDSLAADKQQAIDNFNDYDRGVVNDRGYKAAMSRADKWGLLTQMPNMIAGFFNGLTQMFSGLEQAKATEDQTDQTELQQQRDELNQFFQKGEELCNGANDLLKALIQAESQTNAQIIRA